MLTRYWKTGAPLKAVQVYGRLLHRVRRSRPDVRSVQGALRRGVRWKGHPWRDAPLSTSTTATFLSQTREIDALNAWARNDLPRLWLYNLHYFDDLTAEGAHQRRQWQHAFVRRWVSEHPPAAKPGWDPYPTSLRLVNWIKTAWAGDAAGRSIIDDGAVQSMAVQARWLTRHLEYHLQANHLWANAKALVFVGAFFDNDEGPAWTKAGATLATQELREQILADGGHYERSPMYHAIVLEDVLDLIQLAQLVPGTLPPALIDELNHAAPRMLRWLKVMSHPDGDISFFNDAAFGIAPPLGVLERYARDMAIEVPSAPFRPVEWMKESGYVRLTSPEAVAICDVAPVGPDHQPGHAHADTLSFELSVRGRRKVVNSGTSTYERNELRAWQRSTKAHNTVVVDGKNSSDVWAAFRVGKRARVLNVDTGVDGRGAWATGAHDGYATWGRPLQHTRRWRLTPNDLTIADFISDKDRPAEALLYLAPDVKYGHDVQIMVSHDTSVRCEPAEWFPRFGQTVTNSRVRTPLRNGALTTTISWPGFA